MHSPLIGGTPAEADETKTAPQVQASFEIHFVGPWFMKG
jgi:hypothetical protein